MYTYYVVFYYKDKNGLPHVDCEYVPLENIIKDADDLTTLTSSLENKMKAMSLIITFIKLFPFTS